MNSPLSYVGGKSKLASRIVSVFPIHNCYCEVFSGAAWVFFKKDPSPVEVLNDRDEEIVNLFRVVQNHYEEFLRQFKYLIVSRKIFEIMKRQDPLTLTDIQRAVKHFYILRSSFASRLINPSFGYGTTHKPNLNILDLEEKLLEMHWRLANVYIENLDYKDCIKRYDRPHTLFYLDPPYYGTRDYNYNLDNEDYIELADILSQIEGKFILSLGDHPEVRKIFRAFKMDSLMTTYSKGKKGRDTQRAELIIRNS